MNEHAQKLQTILEKDSLTSKEVQEGVVSCFFAIYRDFVKRRLGDVPTEQVDAALEHLVTQVLDEHHIDPENPDLRLLQRAELALEEQTGFETEPDLLEMHKGIVQTLFSRAKKVHWELAWYIPIFGGRRETNCHLVPHLLPNHGDSQRA